MPLRIILDDLTHPEIAVLLREHEAEMCAATPPESRHVLNLPLLKKPEISFWSVWDGEQLAGCGALKELDPTHGEIKSMRTAKAHLQKGVASLVLETIIAEARRRNYRRLSLETGSQPYFEPARRLYAKFGFEYCPPFDGYVEDPNSVFMTREL
jgi:putative acetyltransferase